MATNARIGLLTKANTAIFIKVAYEGYPSYTGSLLTSTFNRLKQVKELLKKGNIIMLEENLDEVETDSLVQGTENIRFVGSESDLEGDYLADYTYVYKETEKRWYILTDGKLVPCYL